MFGRINTGRKIREKEDKEIVDFLMEMWENDKRVFVFLNRFCRFHKGKDLWSFYLHFDIRINVSSVNRIYVDRKRNRIIPSY